MTTKAIKDRYPCPTEGCEGGVWLAFYQVPQSRGVDLFLVDGKPEEGDADDARVTYDEDPGVTDFYECSDCGGRINPDGTIDEPGCIDTDDAETAR